MVTVRFIGPGAAVLGERLIYPGETREVEERVLPKTVKAHPGMFQVFSDGAWVEMQDAGNKMQEASEVVAAAGDMTLPVEPGDQGAAAAGDVTLPVEPDDQGEASAESDRLPPVEIKDPINDFVQHVHKPVAKRRSRSQ
jgi:hypothetical protein